MKKMKTNSMKTMKKKNKRSDMMMKSNMKIIAMLWRMMVI